MSEINELMKKYDQLKQEEEKLRIAIESCEYDIEIYIRENKGRSVSRYGWIAYLKPVNEYPEFFIEVDDIPF